MRIWRDHPDALRWINLVEWYPGPSWNRGVDNAATVGMLLAGPRGRGLCMEVSGVDLLMAEIAAALARAVAQQPVPSADQLSEVALLEALAAEVSHAAYWGPPGDEERAAADPAVAATLRPIAAAVASASGAAWWTRPLLTADQHYVSSLVDSRATRGDPPRLSGARQRLKEAQRRTQQADSVWWSTPSRADAVATSTPCRRPAGALPALQLALVEDPL